MLNNITLGQKVMVKVNGQLVEAIYDGKFEKYNMPAVIFQGRRIPRNIQGIVGEQAAVACACAAATLLAVFMLGYHPPRSGEVDVLLRSAASQSAELEAAPQRVWSSDTDWREYSIIGHPLLGHGPKPNEKGAEHHRDFEAVYTTGPDGWRVLPFDPPEILFLGCSFTFGIGVNDDETFPALLASKPWRGFRIRNQSFSGYGTNHAYVMLREALAAPKRPACVFYAYANHADRTRPAQISLLKGGEPFSAL